MDLKRFRGTTPSPRSWLRHNWDRAGAWALTVLGVVVLYIGWDRTSGSGYPAEQLPYLLSAGIGGALLVAFGATLLLSADLRDEWHKLDRLERTFERIESRLADAGHRPVRPPANPEAPRKPAAEPEGPSASDRSAKLTARR